MEEKNTDIGVIIGRFQIHELHNAHIALISTVLNKHEKVILFLGTSQATSTRKNPLDFITRKLMIEDTFKVISAILPLPDQKSNDVWSKSIDQKVREVFPSGSVTLYGSRDSFIPYYSGNFKTKELEPESYVNATDIRDKISKKTLSSADFRAGVIYSVYSQYPTMFSTIDVLIRNEEGDLLLARKPNEQQWRFIGGFVDPTDENEIATCRREVMEEAGIEIGDFKFIDSFKVNDWRYSGVKDRAIMTHFYEAKYIFGSPQPMDDIAELKWFKTDDIDPNNLVGEHKKMYAAWLRLKNL